MRHTPGHQVLYLKLSKTGPILLTGDLYHYQEERNTDKTPTFEFDRDQSLASRAAIEAFAKKTGAQLWIEHDLNEFQQAEKKAPDLLRVAFTYIWLPQQTQAKARVPSGH